MRGRNARSLPYLSLERPASLKVGSSPDLPRHLDRHFLILASTKSSL